VPEAVQVLGGPPVSTRVDAIAPEQVIEAWRMLPAREHASIAEVLLSEPSCPDKGQKGA
jgi:hypothetical protein